MAQSNYSAAIKAILSHSLFTYLIQIWKVMEAWIRQMVKAIFKPMTGEVNDIDQGNGSMFYWKSLDKLTSLLPTILKGS